MLRIKQEALTFDDVLLVPAHSTVLPNTANLSTQLTKEIRLNIPMLSAAMDTVTETKLAISLAQEGGIGFIHKNMTIERQADRVRKVKKFESGIVSEPVTVSPDLTLAALAEMVKKKGDSKNNPIVSITPYFFTQMVSRSSALKVVWPKDGAIVSPVFIMAKKDNEKAKTVVEFFKNSSVGKILSSNGKFPTTVKDVDNLLEDNNGFLFCGWDYIHNNDIVKIMKESEKLFNEEILK